jgi:hypothetical protein
MDLKQWNFLCAIVHGFQGIAAIYLTSVQLETAKNFRVPLKTHYAVWDQELGPQDATQNVAVLHFAAITCAVPFLSAIAHILMWWKNVTYNDEIKILQNPYRWLEYSISSTLMFFLICLLFSIYDLITLILLMTINIIVMLTGYFMEKVNSDNIIVKKIIIKWDMFYLGSILALIQWSLVFSTLTTTDDTMPSLIWAVIFVYLYLFSVFPINMWNFYYSVYKKKTAAWKDTLFIFFPFLFALKEKEKQAYDINYIRDLYKETEVRYMILSLTSKSFLLWLILFGVNQPSPYTQSNII